MLSRAVTRRVTRPSTPWMCLSCRRAYSDASPPPLLVKLRNDLKTAMRARDTARLDVLKGVLAEVTNASKTSNPIQNDMQLLSLLRKKTTASDAAIAQFKQAGRQDLVQKEESQVAVLQEYASGVDTMSLEDVRQAVTDTIVEMRGSDPNLKAGSVMKTLFSPQGKLDGKPFDKSIVPGLVKEALTSS